MYIKKNQFSFPSVISKCRRQKYTNINNLIVFNSIIVQNFTTSKKRSQSKLTEQNEVKAVLLGCYLRQKKEQNPIMGFTRYCRLRLLLAPGAVCFTIVCHITSLPRLSQIVSFRHQPTTNHFRTNDIWQKTLLPMKKLFAKEAYISCLELN